MVRIRDVLAIVVGLAVVGALGVVAWMWLSDTIDEEPAAEAEVGDDAQATADAYLEAWEAGDLRTMQDLVRDPPEDFAALHRQMLSALDPTSITFTQGELATPVDGRATVPVTIALELAILDEAISWDTSLELLRERGHWGVQWTMSTMHPEMRPTWRFAITSEEVPRQPILAADGTPLAGDRPRVTFGFQPALVDDPDAVIDAFAQALPGAEVAAERELSRDDLNDDWFYPVITVSEDRADAVSFQLREASGILRRTDSSVRSLIDDGFAHHVTGIIAEATAEQLEDLGPDAAPGIEIPQFGLEAALDDQLTGSEVIRVGLRESTAADAAGDDADNGAAEADDRAADSGDDGSDDTDGDGDDATGDNGDATGDSDDADNADDEAPTTGAVPEPGGELRVVIAEVQRNPSAPVQTTIDVPVQRAIEHAISEVDGPAAIVVIDAQTGAIAGSASRPLGGYNRAFSGRYPPGSTFKVITAEAAVANGLNPGDTVECPGETVIGGLRVPNAGTLELGTTTFEQAFARSCNTTFAQLGGDLGAQALEEAAARFGFGVDPLTPLTAFGGSFPTPADRAEQGAAAFGQARVEASVLHMASVAAAVAGGTWHQPYLLVDDGPGEQRALAAGTTDVLRELMRATVTDGSGEPAAVEGEDVGGKTGTAQGTDGVEHAWFIGIWGGYGFAVLIEDGGSGGAVAGPVAGRLVEELVRQTTAEAEETPGSDESVDPDDDGEVADSDADPGADDGQPVENPDESRAGDDDAPDDETGPPDDETGPPDDEAGDAPA